MGQQSNYWSCSQLANFIRGTEKGEAKSSEDWHNWRVNAKNKHPFRFWLAEEALDSIQTTIRWPLDKLYDIKHYINNRWVSRTHSLTAHPRDIRPGTWCDVGERFLPCLFNELVDFVEIELAWFHLNWAGKEERKRYNTPWWATGQWRIRTWRCRQAGLDNLAWQMNLRIDETWGITPENKEYGQPTHQAIKAKEILELYKWWTEVRPNRPDPYDVSGWNEYCDLKRKEFSDTGREFMRESKNPETRKLGSKALKLIEKIEQQYEREDEQMLIKLIRIRKNLWT